MNMLFVCSARQWGGNERWTALAMSQLSGMHKIFLAYRNPDLSDSFGKEIPKRRLPFTHVLDLLTIAGLAGIVLRESIDVLVSTKQKDYFLCALVSRILKRKHVIRLGIARYIPSRPWNRWIYRRGCDAIVVNAKAIADVLCVDGLVPPSKVHVVYNGVYPAAQRMRKKNTIFTIVCVGALIRRKGQHILIQAVASMDERLRSSFRLIFIGKGKDEEQLIEEARSMLSPGQVVFQGFQPEPMKIVEHCDLFALLSNNEGISNSLLEAMARGIPVMTTPAGGNQEFITHGINGFLVERYPDIVKRELIALLRQPDKLKRIGENGKRTISERFSMQTMTHSLNALLKDLVNEPFP